MMNIKKVEIKLITKYYQREIMDERKRITRRRNKIEAWKRVRNN